MVCNTGISLTPIVNGETLHFESRGLYDGVSILWDRETETLWHHITGEAMFGELKGNTLAPVLNLLQTTVEAALEANPDLEVAISERPIRRRGPISSLAERVPVLSRMFRRTMEREDTRRSTMDVGLGVRAAASTPELRGSVTLPSRIAGAAPFRHDVSLRRHSSSSFACASMPEASGPSAGLRQTSTRRSFPLPGVGDSTR